MEIYKKRWRVMLGMVILAGLIYACVIIIENAAELAASCTPDKICFSTPMGFKVFSIFAIILFGLLGISSVKSLIKPQLVLKITDEGFYTTKYGFVEWGNVVGIDSMPITMFTKFIKFYVRDFSKIKANMSKISRIMLAPDGEMCSISLGGTGANFDIVYAIMLEKWQAAQNMNN